MDNIGNPSFYTSSNLKITLNSDDCSTAISDYKGMPHLLRDNYVIRGSTYDSDDWTTLDVNSETCELFLFDGGFKTVRENYEGIFTLWYNTNTPETKIEAEFKNNYYPYHKFSIIEEIEFVSSNIEYNSQLVNLSNLKGTSTDKATLAQEDDIEFDISGLNYIAGDGFPLLWSVDWIDDRRVNLNYGHTVYQTPIGESYFLDPMIWGTLASSVDADFPFTSSNWVKTEDSATNISQTLATNKLTMGANLYTGGYPLWHGAYWKNEVIDDMNAGDFSLVFDFRGSDSYTNHGWYLYLDSGARMAVYSVSSHNASDCEDTYIYSHDGTSASSTDIGSVCAVNGVEMKRIGDVNTITYGAVTYSFTDSSDVHYLKWSAERFKSYGYSGNNDNSPAGAGAYVEIKSLTMLAEPDPPTSLSIDTQDVANEITIRWVTPSDDGGASISAYKVYLGGALIATTGVVNTYDDTIAGGEIDASLTYTVKAVNSIGDSSASNSATVTSWGVPAQVGTVTGTIGANPALSWSAPSSEATITNYKIYRGGSLHDTISSSATTYSDSTNVSAGSTYAYTVSAVSGVGEGSQSASVNVLAGTPPNPATGVSASITNTATAPLDVTVSFSPSGTTGTGTVTGFQLLRDTVAVSTAGLVTSMTNTVPAGGTEYSFTVITLGTHGNSVASSASAVTTPNTPAQVTGLTVTPVSTSRIDLSWSTPSANNSLISGYKVQISSNGGSSYSDVLTGNVNTTYQALSLNGNAQYHFKVSAINGVGTGTASAVSNTYTMTTTPATLTATPVSAVQINLEWGASTGATGYKVEYESPTGNGFTTHTANTGNTDLTKPITGLTTATQYNFRVSGINTGGASVASPEASSYTWGILSAPTLDTITRLTSTSLKLDFTAGGGLPVATGYKIERQTGSGWIELIADTASTSLTFTDTVLSSDQTATYRLYAINNIGTSPVSNERTSDAIVSSGGGGGSSSKAVSSQTGITGLIDLTFIDQIHRVILGEFLSKSINVAWDSSENIEVKSIIVSDSPFRIVFQDVPFVLLGDPSGISNGKINYSVQIPSELCTQQGQLNCVEQKQYDVPVEIQTKHGGSTLTKSSIIKIDLAGGSDIPLVFVLLAIGAVPLAFIIRKVGSGKSKRKVSGSSHKSSKNGSNSKKVSL